MTSRYRHCLQILTGCSRINFLHNVRFGFLIFSKLTILHHFVTYLSNDPRSSAEFSGDGGNSLAYLVGCVLYLSVWRQCTAAEHLSEFVFDEKFSAEYSYFVLDEDLGLRFKSNTSASVVGLRNVYSCVLFGHGWPSRQLLRTCLKPCFCEKYVSVSLLLRSTESCTSLQMRYCSAVNLV